MTKHHADGMKVAIKQMNMTTGDNITRRDALYELASIPLISLGKTQTLKASLYEKMLRFCTAALEGCYELHRGSDIDGAKHAYQCVTTSIPLLETIACDLPRLRKEALDLATQYAIIKTMLGWKFLKRTESIGHALQALELSKESGNILLQMSARSKLNYTYITAKQYTNALHAMQEGEFEVKEYSHKKRGPELPSGVIGNFYSGYATAQAYNAVNPDVSLGIATESQPLDERMALTEFTAPDQWREAAWTYCTKGDFEQTMKWLRKLVDPETLIPCSHQSEFERYETLDILTGVLLLSEKKDMEHITHVWEKTMEWAQLHQKEVLYDSCMTNFALMKSLWRDEEAIRKLMPLTSHW